MIRSRSTATSGIALLLAGCVATSPTPEETQRLAKAANDSQRTGICNIHHIRMQRKLVPIQFGHVPIDYFYSDYFYALLREFPNAREYALEIGLGSQRTRRKALRYVCPECKRAAREWVHKHPNDEWAKSLAQLRCNHMMQLTPSRAAFTFHYD